MSVSKRYRAIYKEAQDLAGELAAERGFELTSGEFHSQHPNPRVRAIFSQACNIIQDLKKHEMIDIVEEVEEELELELET